MIITETPHRISLFGGGTDYEDFYRQHGSLLIGFALDKYIYVCCRALEQFTDHKIQLHYSIVEKVYHREQIKHPVVKAVLEYLGYDQRLHMSIIQADIPARTGMGSSSTFTIGLLNAICHLQGRRTTKKILTNNAITIERKLLKEPGGIQDQIWAAYGGINSITINEDGKFRVRPLNISQEFIQEFCASCLLLYTGKREDGFDVAASYNNEQSYKWKKELKDIASEALVAFHKEDIDQIAFLLRASWQMKKQISPQISNREIDLLCHELKKYGARGWKLLGSGKSGFIFCIVHPWDQKRLIEHMKMPWLPIGVDYFGSRVIFDTTGLDKS